MPHKPRRQEQEQAREEITEIAPNVLRMELPISMPGLGHVNMYTLLDERGAAVVDPGLPTKSSWEAIQHRLQQAGLKAKDVHTVIVTHSHPDHFGGANRFAKESGAEVVAHRSFKFGVMEASDESDVSVDDLSVSERDDAHKNVVERWNHRTPWGGQHPRPPFKMRMRWRLARWVGRSMIPQITTPVVAGDVLRLAGRDWFVTHTPGHTEDHICLHDPEGRLFLSGDHVLPTITPHISGLALAKDPLMAFFESLDQVAAIPDVEQALPAHGHPFPDLAGRAPGDQGAPLRPARLGEAHRPRARPRQRDGLHAGALQAAELGRDGRERDLRPPRAPADRGRGRGPPRRRGFPDLRDGLGITSAFRVEVADLETVFS